MGKYRAKNQNSKHYLISYSSVIWLTKIEASGFIDKYECNTIVRKALYIDYCWWKNISFKFSHIFKSTLLTNVRKCRAISIK